MDVPGEPRGALDAHASASISVPAPAGTDTPSTQRTDAHHGGDARGAAETNGAAVEAMGHAVRELCVSADDPAPVAGTDPCTNVDEERDGASEGAGGRLGVDAPHGGALTPSRTMMARLRRVQMLLKEDAQKETAYKRLVRECCEREATLHRLVKEVRTLSHHISELVSRHVSIHTVAKAADVGISPQSFFKRMGYSEELHYQELVRELRGHPEHIAKAVEYGVVHGMVRSAPVMVDFVLNTLFDDVQDEHVMQCLLKTVACILRLLHAHAADGTALFVHNNAFVSTLLRRLCVHVGGDVYLATVLSEPLHTIIQDRHVTLELDPWQLYNMEVDASSGRFRGGGKVDPRTFVESPELRRRMQENCRRLSELSLTVLNSVRDNVHTVPYPIRYVAQVLHNLVERSDRSHATESERSRALAELMFASFLSQGLVNPEIHGITTDVVNSRTRRNLHILAHVIGHVASGTTFASEHMKTMNYLVREVDMGEYFDALVCVPGPDEFFLVYDAPHVVVHPYPAVVYPNQLYAMHGVVFASRSAQLDAGAPRTALDDILDRLGRVPPFLAARANRLLLLRMAPDLRTAAEEKLAQRHTADHTPVGIVKRKLALVLQRCAPLCGSRDAKLMDIVKRERGMSQASGGKTQATQLYEIAYCLQDLPMDMHDTDFEVLVADMERDAVEMGRSLDVWESMQELMVLREELQMRVDMQHAKAEKILVFLNNFRTRTFLQVKSRKIGSFVEDWLAKFSAERHHDCDDQVLGEEHFVCGACMAVLLERQERIHGFLVQLYQDMQADQLWEKADKAQLDEAVAWTVNNMMTTLKETMMPSCGEDDVFFEHVQSLHIVTPDYQTFFAFLFPDTRDKPPSHFHEQTLLLALEELLNISTYTSPYQKLLCLVNSRRTVLDILSQSSVPSADDYLPLLIYVLIKANVSRLLSNMQYIHTYTALTGTTELAKALADYTVAIKCIAQLDLSSRRGRPQREAAALALDVSGGAGGGPVLVPPSPTSAKLRELETGMLKRGFSHADISAGIQVFHTEEQLVTFLQACADIKDLGFSVASIYTALFETGNSKARAVEFLLSTE